MTKARDWDASSLRGKRRFSRRSRNNLLLRSPRRFPRDLGNGRLAQHHSLPTQGKHACNRRRESANLCLRCAEPGQALQQTDGSRPAGKPPKRSEDRSSAPLPSTRPGSRKSGSVAQSLIAGWFLLPSHSQPNSIPITILSRLPQKRVQPSSHEDTPAQIVTMGVNRFLETHLTDIMTTFSANCNGELFPSVEITRPQGAS